MRDSVSTASEGDENHKLPADDPFQPCGYTVLRFRVTHPGLYLFHCHHLFHEMMGQMRLFYTKGSTIPPPPENVLTCSKMTAPVVQAALPHHHHQSSGSVENTQVGENPPSQVGNSENNININLPQAVESRPEAGSPNNIKINLTQATQAGRAGSPYSNLEGSESKPFTLTQDGGWIVLLVLSIVLVLISGKSFMMLSRVEGLAQRISSFNDKKAAQV